MRFTDSLTDDALLSELGDRLQRTRLELNLTQQHLADRAGVSRRTLVHAESGSAINLVALVRLLRALGIVANLEALVPEPVPVPMSRTTTQRRRRRASGHRTSPANPTSRPRWGDETGDGDSGTA